MLNLNRVLKPNIQLFAEGGDPPPPNPPAPAAGEGSRTYTEDYVKALRGEAKDNRLKATGLEKSIRAALGLKDDEDLGDLNQRLTARETAALQAANNRLIAAEVRALEGYDHKLLSKVIDLSGVKVDDKGEVTGVKEAAEAATKEYPAVKSSTKPPFVPPNPAAGSGNDNPHQTMNALIRGKR